jgi:hypothetical protein
MVERTTRERLETQLEGMKEERQPFEPDWLEIGRLCLPNRVDIVRVNDNANRSKRKANVASHDTSGRIAARRLVNGMATGLTSASRPWFKLTVRDLEMRDYQPIKEWLDEVEQGIYTLFARTNYYEATKMQYADLGTMGIGCTIGLEHPVSGWSGITSRSGHTSSASMTGFASIAWCVTPSRPSSRS